MFLLYSESQRILRFGMADVFLAESDQTNCERHAYTKIPYLTAFGSIAVRIFNYFNLQKYYLLHYKCFDGLIRQPNPVLPDAFDQTPHVLEEKYCNISLTINSFSAKIFSTKENENHLSFLWNKSVHRRIISGLEYFSPFIPRVAPNPSKPRTNVSC